MTQENRSDLAVWMYRKGITDAGFAEAVKADLAREGKSTKGVSVAAVRKWKSGANMPRKDKLRAISNVTDGEVNVQSFVTERERA